MVYILRDEDGEFQGAVQNVEESALHQAQREVLDAMEKCAWDSDDAQVMLGISDDRIKSYDDPCRVLIALLLKRGAVEVAIKTVTVGAL